MHRAHTMPFGARITEGGVEFSLWAPSVREVTLLIDGAERPMAAAAEGWHRLLDPQARPGSLYRYRIEGGLSIPDPASRFQPDDIDGPSQVVDPAAFIWSDGDWRGRPWEEAVLYEAHVGTATPEGTFAALTAKLDHLRDLGITALELLPVADFPGNRGWGYDGVLHYAPDHAYGTPDDLKRLVDEAHRRGIMMFLDVVYNHFGPSGTTCPTTPPPSSPSATKRPGAPASISTARPRPWCATTSSTMRSTGWRNIISTACVSTRFTPSPTTAAGTSSASWPSASARGCRAAKSIWFSKTPPTRRAGSSATRPAGRSSTTHSGPTTRITPGTGC